MTLTDRDRKIVLALIPALVAAAYWFLLLAPKRDEATRLSDSLAQVEQERDDAAARAAQLESARGSYAKDYATVVRVGKAIPSSLDMPSLIVQLDHAAEGTGIRFKRINSGERADAPPPPPPSEGSETGPGQARDAADGAAATAEGAGSSGDPAAATAPTGTSGVPGLDSVPLEFTFSGSFFDLADFFHRMKRFVQVANERVRVDGRLMTIDGFNFESTAFPTIKTEVQATVYLTPKTEGATAGATPSGPAPVAGEPAASTSSTPPPAGGSVPAATEGVQ